jgi:hypothetical protein
MLAVPAVTTPPTGAAWVRLVKKSARARVRGVEPLALKFTIAKLIIVFMIFLFRIEVVLPYLLNLL